MEPIMVASISQVPQPVVEEVWRVIETVAIRVGTCAPTCATPGAAYRVRQGTGADLLLLGFHPRTKVLLHTYGPFSPAELLQFAALNQITLPD
jgi:hypothetical protein